MDAIGQEVELTFCDFAVHLLDIVRYSLSFYHLTMLTGLSLETNDDDLPWFMPC